MNKLVYIILVNYNGAIDTINCINSINKITYLNFRVVIIDNGSEDDSADIIKNYILTIEQNERFELIKSKENLGFSGGNNVGIQYALNNGADYILLLNNDTIVENDFIDHLICVYSEKTGISIGKILYLSDKSRIWYAGGSINNKLASVKHYNFNKKDQHDKQIMNVTFATGCCMLISKKIITEIGFLDESYFLYWEDTDYSFRVINAGYKIIYNPSAIVYHNVSSSTIKGSKLMQYYELRNELLFIRKNIKLPYKITAYTHAIMRLLYHKVKGKVDNKLIYLALKDFVLNKYGKSTNLL